MRFVSSTAPAPVILIRLMVGWVFLSEGIQKFLFPATLGAGRFAQIGLPDPKILAALVGGVEILFAALLLFGRLTRLATIPLFVVISVAIWTTKIPILMKQGFWPMAPEARTDFCMVFGLIFLLIVGASRLSIDFNFQRIRAR